MLAQGGPGGVEVRGGKMEKGSSRLGAGSSGLTDNPEITHDEYLSKCHSGFTSQILSCAFPEKTTDSENFHL